MGRVSTGHELYSVLKSNLRLYATDIPCYAQEAVTLCLLCSCSNRAAAYLALGMWDEALMDAERARVLAQDALKRAHTAVPLFIKTFAQKGEALIGEASAVHQMQRYAASTLTALMQSMGVVHKAVWQQSALSDTLQLHDRHCSALRHIIS